ncbi:DNA-entry nuclease [Enterococcus sp. AZ194]
MDVPSYDGEHQEIEINNNKPTFTKEELALDKGSWEDYSDLDRYNRVGVANAMLGKDLFPTEKREPLHVNPTGWKQKKLGDNQWLYNRSHLIGFQLTGQNNNLKNLMTGTRSLNSPHMLVHENDITNYIKTTNHHVRYRVTPYFKGDELLARGIQLEARSIEDNEIQFNVFIYNVQDGMSIDYQTGQAKKE